MSKAISPGLRWPDDEPARLLAKKETLVASERERPSLALRGSLVAGFW
jgi:hypothetical protein